MFGTPEGLAHPVRESDRGATMDVVEDGRSSSIGIEGGPDARAMRFARGVTWRISQRGLVVCGPGDAPCSSNMRVPPTCPNSSPAPPGPTVSPHRWEAPTPTFNSSTTSWRSTS